jgi:hypothetical protein
VKDKTSTYLLILCIISVWGIVGYKLFIAFNNGASVTNHKPKMKQERTNQTQVDFELYLNYPDPFLNKNIVETNEKIILNSKSSSAINSEGVAIKPLQNRELASNKIQIRYKGLINNLSKIGQVAIVEINEIQQVTYIGDTFLGQKVIKITTDSICLLKGKDKIWISRL